MPKQSASRSTASARAAGRHQIVVAAVDDQDRADVVHQRASLLHQRQPGALLQLLGHDQQARPAGGQALQRLGLGGDHEGQPRFVEGHVVQAHQHQPPRGGKPRLQADVAAQHPAGGGGEATGCAAEGGKEIQGVGACRANPCRGSCLRWFILHMFAAQNPNAATLRSVPRRALLHACKPCRGALSWCRPALRRNFAVFCRATAPSSGREITCDPQPRGGGFLGLDRGVHRWTAGRPLPGPDGRCRLPHGAGDHHL
jgi:hypothetical protein